MIQKEDIFVNETYWRNLSPGDLELFVDKIFTYYRENGFPYYETTKEYRDKEYEKLRSYDINGIIDGDIIKQTMHGLGLAWSYFPHAFNVPCNNKKTPVEIFNSDDDFKACIRKRLKMGTYISDSGIRKMLRLFTGTQAVSNFRPTAAAAIYNRYSPGGVTWDMSCGWGGRMLGAFKGGVKKYIGTDPSKETMNGLMQLSSDYSNYSKTDVELHQCGSETIRFDGIVDLCFTSPPYFDLEKYSNEETQSYLKYSTKKDWVNGFLSQTIKNCYASLNGGGYMIMNIADPKKVDISLEKEMVRLAIENKFTHVETLKLSLSNPKMVNKETAFKYEPVFVFKK